MVESYKGGVIMKDGGYTQPEGPPENPVPPSQRKGGEASAAISDITTLLNDVCFDDLSYKVAVSMCEIVVKGEPCNYVFQPDWELPGYWADGNEDGHKNIWLDELIKNLLLRAGLVEINDEGERKVSITPTVKAFKLYTTLEKEGRLDERGYLDGKDSGFC